MSNAQPIEPVETHLINEVLTDYLQLRGDAVKSFTQTVTAGDQILSAWMATKRELDQANWTQGDLFDPLQSIEIGETAHSALLGDLLNPRGSHGQGGLFLESFLRLIEVP